MPRGRKGSPQESVDSILLALSRRDDIDPETLSHYFERLDEEWTGGAREKVFHLLRASDPSAHAAAVLIFAELATDDDLEELEDFVTDPTVGDMAKLSLSPILRELGSEMADDGIIEYLNDPAGAMQQMQMRLLELVGQSEMGIESILEDVTSMPLERRLAFVYWLGSSNDPRAANLLIPLLENQSGKVASAVVEALERLGAVAIQQTIPALKHVISSSSNRALKQSARAALGRLTMQATPGVEDEVMTEARQPLLPPHKARTSFIDGSGSQLVMLSWKRPDGLLKGVNVLCQDRWGIKDCYGLDEVEMERWDELVRELERQGFVSFHVPFDNARALVAEARTLNRRTHRKLPVAYSIWRPFIEAEGSNKQDVFSMSTMLDLLPLNEETIALAQRGGELYQIPEFVSWMYDPLEQIEPYITRYWSTHHVFDNSSGKRTRGRGGRKAAPREHEQNTLLENLVSEALDKLVDDKWRLLYETRLRRQAALFHFTDRQEHVPLMRAVATLLHPDSQIPVREQEFARTLMRISIEQGPLRMMVETLGSGGHSALPINLFDQDQ
jgi:hypothetical protein